MLAYSLGKAADKHLYFSGFGPGQIGVPQLITMTEVCDQFGAQITFSATYSDGVTVSANPVTANNAGSATVYWTPNRLGTVTSVSANSTCTPVTATTNFAISPVSTITTIRSTTRRPMALVMRTVRHRS